MQSTGKIPFVSCMVKDKAATDLVRSMGDQLILTFNHPLAKTSGPETA